MFRFLLTWPWLAFLAFLVIDMVFYTVGLWKVTLDEYRKLGFRRYLPGGGIWAYFKVRNLK